MDDSYSYTWDDLNHIPTKNSKSSIDENILNKWVNIEKSNVFNYKLLIEEEKMLPGSFGFYVQLNTARSLKRRKPQSMSSLMEPFDQHKFNFTKINANEIIFNICFNNTVECTLIINASPLTIGHCLICPDLTKCLPQKLTLSSIEAAVRLIWLSSNRDLRIGYNSPGALASVNHLHFHILYVNQRLAIEKVMIKYILPDLYEITDYPACGFCILIDNKTEIRNACEVIMNVIDSLIDLNIPHNVVMSFGKPVEESSENKDSLRILIFPRKDNFGCKLNVSFNLAFCEFSGYIPVGNVGHYKSLTEDQVTDIMRENTIKEFQIAKQTLLAKQSPS